MRLVVLSTLLPLVLGVAACVAPSDGSLDSDSAPANEVTAASPENTERAAAVVNRVDSLLQLNQQWNERVRAGTTTADAKRAAEDLVNKMRAALAPMSSDGEWVNGYATQHRDAIKAGFVNELATNEVRTAIGADQVQKLNAAVSHAGGVDEIIVKSSEMVRAHSQDVSDILGQGKKMPLGFFCAMAGTVAGANAARENWRGVVVPMYVLLRAGCIR